MLPGFNINTITLLHGYYNLYVTVVRYRLNSRRSFDYAARTRRGTIRIHIKQYYTFAGNKLLV